MKRDWLRSKKFITSRKIRSHGSYNSNMFAITGFDVWHELFDELDRGEEVDVHEGTELEIRYLPSFIGEEDSGIVEKKIYFRI